MRNRIYLVVVFAHLFNWAFSNNNKDIKSESKSKSPTEYTNHCVKVGTIRWDAWIGDRNRVGLEIERTLSGIPMDNPTAPAKTDFHWRVPWFGSIQPDNKVIARYTDMLTLEKEIRYSKAAGIDYWATVWYGDHSDTVLSLHRNMWTKSLQRNSMQWCHLFDNNFRRTVGEWKTPAQKKLITDIVSKDFKSDGYLKTNSGRPVNYIIWAEEAAYADCINALYAECAAQGVPEPFIIIMTKLKDENAINSTAELCRASGISAYVIEGYNDITFQESAEIERGRWELWNKCDGVAIPSVSTGWDNRPRYYTGCFWYPDVEYMRNSWIQYPTLTELEDHTADAIRFSQTNPKATDFSSILIYAWNEYDEGGFIAPTLFQLQDTANKSRPVKLDAINCAIQPFRVKYTDVEGHIAAHEIRQLASAHIFSGVSKEKFLPDQLVKVNEYTAWLVRTFGLYADVSPMSVDKKNVFAQEIAIAKILGILEGQDVRRQGASVPITDQEVILLTANVMKLLKMSDSDTIVRDIFSSMNEKRFTRAKAAVVLCRALELPFKKTA